MKVQIKKKPATQSFVGTGNTPVIQEQESKKDAKYHSDTNLDYFLGWGKK